MNSNIVIGIDIGGSTTKIVGFENTDGGRRLITPQFVRANDPLTATYGAFGKFTDENHIAISEISKVYMTGVGSSFIKRSLYGIDCVTVPEFNCIGKGGLFLSGLDNALVVSMGTGTALVHAVRDGKMEYLGGTGVGGGTLIGLSKLLIGAEGIDHIVEYAEGGDLGNIDLRIKDMTAKNMKSDLQADMTASNFGNVSDVASKSDIALGIMNMVFETVGMVSVFAARHSGVSDIVLTGNLSSVHGCEAKFEELNRMNYGVHFTIPRYAQYSTVIGCALG